MRIFLRLNALAVLFALMVAVPVLADLNANRILRVMDWEPDTLVTASFFLNSVWIAVLSAAGFLLIRRWLGVRPSRFVLSLLWIPYFLLIYFLFGLLFPVVDTSDRFSEGTELTLLFWLSITPFWIAFLCAVAGSSGPSDGEVLPDDGHKVEDRPPIH